MKGITITRAFTCYNDHLRMYGKSPNSIALNGYALAKLIEHLKDDVDVETLDRTRIRSFITWLTETGLSSSTAARIFDVLRALFGYLVEDELITESPMSRMKRPKVPAHPVTPLTTDEVQSMIDKCPSGTFTGIRNRLVIALLFDAGMRATELCMVDLTDVNELQRTILLRHTKTGTARTAFYSSTVAKLIQKYLIAREGVDPCPRLIVTETGGPVDRHWLKNMLVRIGAKAGLHVHPHQFRHSCGVAMLRNGSDVFSVQKLLGHASLAMTRHYVELADSDVAEVQGRSSPSDRLRVSNLRRKR